MFLFTHEYAHHVIQKIIIDFPEEKRNYINECIFENLDKICMNEYGALCVIKFIIVNINLLYRIELIKSINKHFVSLMSNRFGYNVILFMIEKYGVGYSGFIFNEIKQNLIYFSANNINSVSLVIKVINYMSKYDKFNFINLTWEIFKTDEILFTMLKFENGINILSSILKLTDEQRNYFNVKTYNVLKEHMSENRFIYSVI